MSVLLLSLFIVGFIALPRWNELHEYDFDQYCKDFGKVYKCPKEYKLRKQLFEEKIQNHISHNADKSKTWKHGVNQFTDMTPKEFKAMHTGSFYARQHRRFQTVNRDDKITLAQQDFTGQSVDWRTKGVITAVKDQGRCGSCWSFAAAESMESYFALANPGQLRVLSEQQILDCTPNPKQCGGTGGCGGATAELAFAAIQKMGGLSSEWTYPYISYFGDSSACNSTRFIPVAKISGFTNLPQNKAAPILDHLLNVGPLAISVDASTWSSYEGGVFDGCNQTNPDLDHAVQLVGFGTDPQLGDYWLVRNSWSPMWGEEGYIRLRRTPVERCGTDITPLDGDGCRGGPPTEYVCGTCGLVYDALYPNIV